MIITNNKISVNRRTEAILLCILFALSLVLPFLYHFLGMKGIVFLPIFLSLAIASTFSSFPALIILAISVPLANHLFTGMPDSYMLGSLMFEGVVFSILIFVGRGKSKSFYLLYLVSFTLARVSSFFYFQLTQNTPVLWYSNLVIGIPGFILNTLVASLVFRSFNGKRIEY